MICLLRVEERILNLANSCNLWNNKQTIITARSQYGSIYWRQSKLVCRSIVVVKNSFEWKHKKYPLCLLIDDIFQLCGTTVDFNSFVLTLEPISSHCPLLELSFVFPFCYCDNRGCLFVSHGISSLSLTRLIMLCDLHRSFLCSSWCDSVLCG